jgi:hypothetical protein
MSNIERDPASQSLNLSGMSGASILRATREPCPVCGHPTGDCTGTEAPPKHIAGMGPIETLRHAQTVYVEEDIWEEHTITPGRTTRILKHKKGSTVSYDEAKILGLI